jgi:hypothetical protein
MILATSLRLRPPRPRCFGGDGVALLRTEVGGPRLPALRSALLPADPAELGEHPLQVSGKPGHLHAIQCNIPMPLGRPLRPEESNAGLVLWV